MNTPKTLLEWLKSQRIDQIRIWTGYDENDALSLYSQLKTYGLLAFDVLPVNTQIKMLSAYMAIYQPI